MAKDVKIPAPVDRLSCKEGYRLLLAFAEKHGDEKQAMRRLCLNDLYFLLSEVLSCAPIFKVESFNQDWIYNRVREVEQRPNNRIDLVAREHLKTTIGTFGLTIQDVLFDPEITVGIFAFNRPIAKGFLRQIKRELEDNKLLLELFPDVLWEKPETQSPKWSEDDGLLLKRKGNPKESTIEAWGLIESMPTGRHFGIRVYDDIITEKFVTNEDMIKGAIEQWELSLNLGSAVPVKRYGVADIARYYGTRYHVNDPYAEIMRRKAAVPRIRPGTKDGTERGEPVMWTRQFNAKKRRDMGPHTYASQILLNPAADKAQGFDEEWLREWTPERVGQMNTYILVDPANAKNKKSDYTVMAVVALSSDRNYRVVEGVRSRLNLTERTKLIIRLHQKYHPKGVGYEQYGMQADIQHIEEEMNRIQYNFFITPLGGNIPKTERIRRLIPIAEMGRFFIPKVSFYLDNQGIQQNFTVDIRREIQDFPLGAHDDVLDCIARITEDKLDAQFPGAAVEGEEETIKGQEYTDNSSPQYDFMYGRQQTRQQTFQQVMWRK